MKTGNIKNQKEEKPKPKPIVIPVKPKDRIEKGEDPKIIIK